MSFNKENETTHQIREFELFSSKVNKYLVGFEAYASLPVPLS